MPFDETASQLEAKIEACNDQMNALNWLVSNMEHRAITDTENQYILIAMTMHAAAGQAKQRLEIELIQHRARNDERGIQY